MPVSAVQIPAYPIDGSGQLLVDLPTMKTLLGEPITRTVYLGRVHQSGRATVRIENFVEYLRGTPPPASVDYSAKAMRSIRNVLGNDQQGDCVIASGGHGLGIWSANDGDCPGGEILQTTAEALSEYHRIGGPGDNGLVMSRALDDMVSVGLLAAGTRRKIDGWAGVALNRELIQVCISIFGSIRVGFNVPSEWMNGVRDGFVWNTPRSYSFVGGHDVRICGYDAIGIKVCTWGLLGTMTWAAVMNTRIVDEIDVELSPNWYNSDKLTPSGFDVEKLKSAISQVRNGEIPSWQPDPAPTPTPTPVPPTPTPTPVPPVPVTFPDYTGTVHFPLLGDLRVNLSPVPRSFRTGCGDRITGTAPWQQIAADLGKLFTDLGTNNWSQVYGDVLALLRDFGFFSTVNSSGNGRGHKAGEFGPVVPWWTVVADVLRLAAAVRKSDWPGAVSALVKLASDFGIDVNI